MQKKAEISKIRESKCVSCLNFRENAEGRLTCGYVERISDCAELQNVVMTLAKRLPAGCAAQIIFFPVVDGITTMAAVSVVESCVQKDGLVIGAFSDGKTFRPILRCGQYKSSRGFQDSISAQSAKAQSYRMRQEKVEKATVIRFPKTDME
ncbi:MAG: hypothetical protein LBC55_07300 [Desulfovibrio sp.]|nr:hypothetical protein [Desulfovibrio sp.]